ncbi:MAG TPA: hypothetical protein VND19_23400 [Acetobacteraceae bacterium]|nr:hypothetical protein [Acetobacteraceae bacterium]
MAGSRTLVLLLGLSVLSACSPYVYNPEITGFSTGVAAVVSSYQTGRQAVDAIVAQRQVAAEIAARARMTLLPGCTQREPSGTPPRLRDCAIVTFGATAVPAPTPAQQALADAAPAFNALNAYAASLAAVASAADATALSQATQSLTAAAGGLAGAVATLHPAAAPAGALVTSGGSLIGQGIALYLDQRRLAALRSTVPRLDPDVQILGQTVRAALLEIHLLQLRQLDRELLRDSAPLEAATVGRLSAAAYQSKRAAVAAEVAAFNQARAADPAATVTAMVVAHRQLAAALRDNAGQGLAVLTTVRNFIAAAAQLKTAIGAAAKAPVAGNM